MTEHEEITIPRAEYDMLRRALWVVWKHANYVGSTQVETIDGVTTSYLKSFDNHNRIFIGLGLLEDCGRDLYRVTPAAHEFAKEMQAKE